MKKNNKTSLIRFTGQLGLAGILQKLFSIPHSIIYAKFLMPSGYGILQLFKLTISYFGYSQMGILQAVTRNVPVSYSENNFEKAQKIKNIAFSWLSSLTFIGFIILFLFYFFNKKFNESLELMHLILLVFIIFFSQLNNFMKSILKSEGKFNELGKITIANSLFTSIVGIILVYLFSLTGALYALLINSSLIFIITVFYYRDYFPVFFFEFKLFYEQISQGILIFIYRRSEELLKTVSLLIIGYFYGIESVGVFSFGFLSLSAVYKYSASIRIYYYREIMLEKKKDIDYFQKLFDLPHVFNLFFNCFLLVLFASIYLIIICLFLPKYLESIPIIYYSIFGFTFFNSRSFSNQFYDYSDKLINLMKYIFIGLLLGLFLCIYFSFMNYNLFYVAIAVSTGFVVMSSLSIYNSFLIVKGSYTNALLMLFKTFLISLSNAFLIYKLSQFLISVNIDVYLFFVVSLMILFILIYNYLIFSALFFNIHFKKNLDKVLKKIILNYMFNFSPKKIV